jgi:tetratricopeptide (TPR) repeat protein
MSGQRALLILDNAASSAQVMPLLPGGDSCLVLVTSRRHLADLPGAVVPVLLEVLPPGRAREMFTTLAPQAAAGPAWAVAELVALAGFLPLAISLLARLYNRHPSWSLADLTAETRASLLTLTAEQDSVAAAFEVSWQHLDPGQQDFFRDLSRHPGTAADAYAAAALAGVPLARALRLLDDLHGEGLLTETGYRRYGMHDLIRRYVADRAAAGPPAAREAALGRLLDYYQHTAARAEALLGRHAHVGAPAPATPPAAIPELPDTASALAWARAERASLLACIDYAAAAGDQARVVALTAAVAALLRHDGPWPEAIIRHAAAATAAAAAGDRAGQAAALNELGVLSKVSGNGPAAAAALQQSLGIFRDLGDRAGQAHALCYLADVRRLSGDFADAAAGLQEALGLYRDLGNQLGEANVLVDLGSVRVSTGDYPAAARDFAAALAAYRLLGNRLGQANALLELAMARRLTGDYPAAGELLADALGIFRHIGNRDGEAGALNETGALQLALGDATRARESHRQALAVARAIASPHEEASALAGLGRCARAAGDAAAAAARLRQAQEIFERIGAGEAAGVTAELTALAAPARPRDSRGAA